MSLTTQWGITAHDLEAHYPLAFAVALAGCAQQEPAPSAPGPDSSRNPELLQPDLYPKGAVSEPQVRYSRYTLPSVRLTEPASAMTQT